MEDATLLSLPGGPGLVFTVDFITPIVDDPYTFGAIAAANALSDVYAMGGTPQVALAVCGFPDDKIGHDILKQIFLGGRDKAAEVGCVIAGGHTVVDPELKYGLCVLGSVDQSRLLAQAGAQVGDHLVLTKPIGSGIAAQGWRKGRTSPAEMAGAIDWMLQLNHQAKDAALQAGARAATDVTGFGLLGHMLHLLQASGVGATIHAAHVPRPSFVDDLAAADVVPGGTRRNLEYVAPFATFDERVSAAERLILADAQTSGGLLLAVPPDRVQGLLRSLQEAGTPARADIGEICAGPAGSIRVSP